MASPASSVAEKAPAAALPGVAKMLVLAGKLERQQAEAIAARYDRERCQWYARASEAAVSLNQRHKELRQQLRELEQLVMNAKQPVFARSIPVKK